MMMMILCSRLSYRGPNLRNAVPQHPLPTPPWLGSDRRGFREWKKLLINYFSGYRNERIHEAIVWCRTVACKFCFFLLLNGSTLRAMAARPPKALFNDTEFQSFHSWKKFRMKNPNERFFSSSIWLMIQTIGGFDWGAGRDGWEGRFNKVSPVCLTIEIEFPIGFPVRLFDLHRRVKCCPGWDQLHIVNQ